jgi:hypothetical protein
MHPPHINWLQKSATQLFSADGKAIDIWEFAHVQDDAILSDWARHFRNHYCGDDEIDDLRNGTPHSRTEYLVQIKFPTECGGFGPGTRSGDFAEILVADYLEFRLNCWVPRSRYDRNESTKGSDVVGFWVKNEGQISPEDMLVIYESKAQLAGTKTEHRLQDAVVDSAKDELRRAESLNAIKQRLRDKLQLDDAKRVERFQNLEDRPYLSSYGAVAVFSSHLLDENLLQTTDTTVHPQHTNLSLLVIHGKDLMEMAHKLYLLAANEA